MKNFLRFYPIFRQFGTELYAFHQKTFFFFFKNWKFKTWTSVNSSGKSWGTGGSDGLVMFLCCLVNVTESALKIFFV